MLTSYILTDEGHVKHRAGEVKKGECLFLVESSKT